MNNNNNQNFSVAEASECLRLQQRKELEGMNKKNVKPDNSDKETIIYPTHMQSATVTLLCDECGAIIIEGQRECWYCGQHMIWEPGKAKKAKKVRK
jgi:hypothetical protein